MLLLLVLELNPPDLGILSITGRGHSTLHRHVICPNTCSNGCHSRDYSNVVGIWTSTIKWSPQVAIIQDLKFRIEHPRIEPSANLTCQNLATCRLRVFACSHTCLTLRAAVIDNPLVMMIDDRLGTIWLKLRQWFQLIWHPTSGPCTWTRDVTAMLSV